jgi:hypothetical protein
LGGGDGWGFVGFGEAAIELVLASLEEGLAFLELSLEFAELGG